MNILDSESMKRALTPEERKVIFEIARQEFMKTKIEWQKLGWLARIWRAREFKIRLESQMRIARFYDDRFKVKNARV